MKAKTLKKTLAFALSFALLCSVMVVSFVTPASAENPNLIVNGGFETGDMTGWSEYTWDSNQYSDSWPSQARTGDYALLRKNKNGYEQGDGWGDDIVYQSVEVEAGETYVFTAWAKYLVDPQNITLNFVVLENTADPSQIYYKGGTVLGTKVLNPSQADLTSYTEVSIEFTPSLSTVLVGFYQSGGNTDRFYVDDVSLAKKSADPEPQNDPDPVDPLSGERVVNGGFETGDMTGWSEAWKAANMYSAAWPSNAKSGSYSCLRTGGGTGWGDDTVYQLVTVEAGAEYTFSAWTKYTEDGSPTLYFCVIEGTESGYAPYGHCYNNGYKAGTLLGEAKVTPVDRDYDSYKNVTFDFTPSGSQVLVAFVQNGGVSNAFWVDDVSVMKKGEEPAPELLNGFVTGEDGEIRYYVNDEAQYAGVIEYNGNLVYINSTCTVVKNRSAYYVTKTNDLIEVGYYDIDENGVMSASAGTLIGTNLYLDPDGEVRYYDGAAAQYQGVVVDDDGNFYYINSMKKAVKDKTGYVITKTNGLLPAGAYNIDADGKIAVTYLDNDGKLIEKADGEIVYFENGEAQYKGVVQSADGFYYYINSTKKAVKDQTYFITKTNGLIPAAEYTIGADGVIVIS